MLNTPSYWDNTHFDIAIIGAGITGSMAAFFMEQMNPLLSVALIDAHTTPYGATTRNAGFACFGSLSEYIDDANSHGEEYALKLMKQRQSGVSLLQSIFKNDDIGWYVGGGVDLFSSSDCDMYEACLDVMPSINKHLSKNTCSPFKAILEPTLQSSLREGFKCIENELEASIHSVKMISALQKKLKRTKLIFGCNVEALQDSGSNVHIHTSHFQLSASDVMVATNGFTKSLVPQLDVIPNRGQILVTSPIPELSLKGNIHYDSGYYYARQLTDKRVLIGGGRHLDYQGEQTDKMETTSHIQTALESVLKDVILPNNCTFSVDHRWAGIMAFGSSNEKEPLVGSSGNIHHIVRMGGMGVALSPVIARDWVNAFLA